MKHLLKKLLRPLAHALTAPSRELLERVEGLENELDEYRRDSLRVAELIDLLEQQLTPGQNLGIRPTNTSAGEH